MLDWNMGGFDNIRCQKSSGEYWSKTSREQKRSRRKKARLYEMMVDVRKGHAETLWVSSNSSPDAKRQQQILQDCGAEDWLIESCRKI